MNTVLRRAGVAAAAAATVLLALSTTSVAAPLPAQTPSLAPAAAADAYGLDIDATLTSLDIAVDEGPFARSTSEFPPAQAPASDDVLGVGPLPASGDALVQSASVIGSSAATTAEPKAAAIAYAEKVALISQGGVPQLEIETLVAASTTDCVNAPSAEGTTIAGVKVAGVDQNITTPTPNYELAQPFFSPLGLRVILNEQHPTADGRGLVVNALHIYNTGGGLVPSLFSGDIIVSHAMSTVNCPNGAPTTGGDNPIFITKDADKATARPGDTVTYTATVQNKNATACGVNQFIDHLPIAFDFVSTSGAFGTVAETVARPGGGTDVVIKPDGVSIPSNGSATQTFVLKVKDDAAPAVYFNNVEILCAAHGNWVKGLDAPVEVVTDADPTPTPKPDLPECSDLKDNDGDGLIDYPKDPGCPTPQDDNERDDQHPRTGSERNVLWAVGVLLIAGAFGVRRLALR